MNGFEAIYGHLGASKLLNARKPPSPAPTTASGIWWKQSEAKLPKHQQRAEQVDEDGEDEFEDEVIEEMSGNWPPSSSTGVQAVVPRVDSVEWTKMEEGPDEENVVPAGDNDDSSPQRAAQKALKRKRKPSPELKADAAGADQPAGKKRLSCIDCGCRAALKACSKVMCIDCCAKDSRVCDAHAKKLYDQATEKEASSSSGGGSSKVKAGAGTNKPSKKKPKRDGSGPEDDGDGGDEDSGEGSPERDADREVAAVAGDEAGGGKAKRSALYETIAKQDRKIRALQNDLKELRTLLLSVVDKQSTFSRQLRHLSGAQSDGLVIDEDDEGDEDDDDSR